MKLQDNEIRDIVKYLEAGKPLPDQYRFLLFEDKREVELVWNGKTNEVCNVVLPFQTIEHVDEPREESGSQKKEAQFDLFDARGRQLKGWTNKLIWGDNKLILSSLKNGPLRKAIEDQGGIKLIYIDPPFDVGADFSINIEIGDEQFTKEPSVLEELAYRDTWGKGADSFITMIYERLSLMYGLLAEDGSIYVHCDYRLNSFLRLVLGEIFGGANFRNEIIWQRDAVGKGAKKISGQWSRELDNIIYFSKSEDSVFNQQYKASDELTHTQLKEFRYKESDGRAFKIVTLGDYSETSREFFRKQNLIYVSSTGQEYKKYYLDEFQLAIGSLWNDIPNLSHGKNPENISYPTQKPEALLSRIVNASSNEGDLIADFFCGSGTTLAVAEKLGRKWVGSDLGKFSVHTTRKRMIGVQRQLKNEGKNYRAFELLNLGKYERQHYIGVNQSLRDEEKLQQLTQKESEFIELILHAYRAEAVTGFKTFSGKKSARLVAVGPINLPVTRNFVNEIINECVEKQLTKVDVLAFEFEMNLSPNIQEEAKQRGVDLALKHIPKEVFDKKAIEKNQVVFHDVSFVEVKPHFKKNAVAVELMDFGVYYTQDSIDNVAEALKNGANKITMDAGKIVKVMKDKKGIVTKEVLTKKWTDWVDYWAVDFDFESKKEIIRIQDDRGEWVEKWTGGYVFENEWQTFRTKKDRSLELKSVYFEYANKGRYKIAVKVVDIFGNDTMKVIEVGV